MNLDEPIELPIQSQHYVPRGYLKGFTFDGRHFYHRYKQGYNSFKQVSVASVCCLSNYYDLHGTELSEEYGVPIRFLEKDFHRYETILPSILARLKARNQWLSFPDFSIIVEAYLNIKHRNPFTRNHLERLVKDQGLISESIDNILRENPSLPALVSLFGQDFDTIRKKAIQSALADKNAGRKTHLSGLLATSLNENIPIKDAAFKLNEMQVQVLEAPDGHYFFTSDNPGFVGDTQNRAHNTGFGFVSTVYIPINSKQLVRLYGCEKDRLLLEAKPVLYTEIPPIEMQFINSNTYLFASEQVFCSDKKYLKEFKPMFGQGSLKE